MRAKEVKSNRAWREECEALRIEIARLKEQVAELTKERDELHGANILNVNAVRFQKDKLTAAQARIVELREALEVARQAFVSNGDQILKDLYSEFDNRLGMSIDFKECYAEQIAGALAIPDDSAALDRRLQEEYDRGRAALIEELKGNAVIWCYDHEDDEVGHPHYRLPENYTFENGTPFKDKP